MDVNNGMLNNRVNLYILIEHIIDVTTTSKITYDKLYN